MGCVLLTLLVTADCGFEVLTEPFLTIAPGCGVAVLGGVATFWLTAAVESETTGVVGIVVAGVAEAVLLGDDDNFVCSCDLVEIADFESSLEVLALESCVVCG